MLSVRWSLSLGLVLWFSVQLAPKSYFFVGQIGLMPVLPRRLPCHSHSSTAGTWAETSANTYWCLRDTWVLQHPVGEAEPWQHLSWSLPCPQHMFFPAWTLCSEVLHQQAQASTKPGQIMSSSVSGKPPKTFCTIIAQPSSSSLLRQQTPALPELTVISGHLHTWASPAASPKGPEQCTFPKPQGAPQVFDI